VGREYRAWQAEQTWQAMVALMIDFQLANRHMPPWEEFARRANDAAAES
jgi:hypothetical protein